MEGKKTKGKQKREIKKIENEKDLFITFTKRKSGIYKKATELKALCDADVDVLMYSPSGKPFCYGDPSLESMTKSCSKGQQPQEGGIYHQLVEEHKRLEIQQLNETNDSLLDQIYVAKERNKQLAGVLETWSSSGWWEANAESVGSYEQTKEMEASLMELGKKLKNKLSPKSGDTASHDQANIGVGPYPTYGSGSNMSEVAFGANRSDAGGFGGHALTFYPSDQYQGYDPFLYNASNNENAGGSTASHAYNASDENGGFPFPDPFNGYGRGSF